MDQVVDSQTVRGCRAAERIFPIIILSILCTLYFYQPICSSPKF